MNHTNMNHVNLIGKLSSQPTYTQLQDGRKIAKFSLSTKEVYLDKEGNKKTKNNWHLLTAWGRWIKVLEELGQVGSTMAVEGKLVSRFYNSKGERKFISEVEVNDIILM